MEAYTLPNVKWIASGDLLHLVEFCDNLEGCDGMGDGRGTHEGGDICIPMTDSC